MNNPTPPTAEETARLIEQHAISQYGIHVPVEPRFIQQAIDAHVAAAMAKYTTPRPESEWHEDMGSKLWWSFPVEEPPYVGDPRCSNWPEHHPPTHFTDLPLPTSPQTDNESPTDE